MKKYWKIKNKSERIRLRKYYKKIRRQHRLNKKKIELNNHIDQMFNNYNFLFNNFINKKYKPTYKKDKLNTIVETMPKIFSLRDNYVESINFVIEIASLCNRKILNSTKLIYIDMRNCEKYDLDASCLLDSVMDKLKYIAKFFKTDFKVDFPLIKNEKAYINFLTTSFVNDELFHTKDNRPVYELREKVSNSKKVKFVDFDKNKSKNSEIVVTRIIDMIFDKSVDTGNYKADLGQILGEILDNIKEHSGNDFPWYIVGNLIPKDEYNKSRVELVIMNYGKTFYQNLDEFLAEDNKAKFSKQYNKISNLTEKILDKHKTFLNKKYYDLDQIYTYMLLQEGFSSKIVTDDNKIKRGSGIVRLLETLERISNTEDKKKSNMILYSGKTAINFLNKYNVTKNTELGQNLKTICLNDKNSLFQKLDKSAIIVSNIEIPGTLIYLDFELKEELLYEN